MRNDSCYGNGEIDITFEDLAQRPNSEFPTIRQGDHAPASRLITHVSSGENEAARVDDDAAGGRACASAKGHQDRGGGGIIDRLDRSIFNCGKIGLVDGSDRIAVPIGMHRVPSDHSDE